MKRRTKNTKSSGIRSLLIGVGIAAVSYFFLAFVFSVAAYLGSDPTRRVGLFSLISLVVSGAVTGFAVTKKSEGKFTALLSSLILSLILLVVGVIISKGAPSLGNFINIAIYVASVAIFSRLGRHKSSRPGLRR